MVRPLRRQRVIQEMATKSPILKQARVCKACNVKMYISISACVIHNIVIVALFLLLHKDLLVGIHILQNFENLCKVLSKLASTRELSTWMMEEYSKLVARMMKCIVTMHIYYE